MMKKALVLLTIIVLTINGYGQGQKRIYEKSLIEKVNWLGFLIIQIHFGSERYERTELDIIYLQDSVLKIHSFLKSNYDKDQQIDTAFRLTVRQESKIDQFEKYFLKDSFPENGYIIAGTNAKFQLSYNGETYTLEDKSDYCLILDILKE